jgi:hypothetical protein
MAIRDFLRTYKVRMEFTTHSHPVTLWEGDEFIMDALRLRGNCSPRQLQKLNAYRMHLRVSRLSEIASADGRFFAAIPLSGMTQRFISLQRNGGARRDRCQLTGTCGRTSSGWFSPQPTLSSFALVWGMEAVPRCKRVASSHVRPNGTTASLSSATRR